MNASIIKYMFISQQLDYVKAVEIIGYTPRGFL